MQLALSGEGDISNTDGLATTKLEPQLEAVTSAINNIRDDIDDLDVKVKQVDSTVINTGNEVWEVNRATDKAEESAREAARALRDMS